ncbi:MAG: hypothetical protein WCH62_09260, partial [Candidatus Omnitrophota bacterium]
DSNAQIPELEEKYDVNKAIIGKKSVGFIRGRISVLSDDPVKNFAKRLKSLEGCIDKIEEGQELPKKLKLHEGEQFYLLMAKRNKDTMGLYSVRIGYDSPNRCKKMHEMRFDSYETINESKIVYAPEVEAALCKHEAIMEVAVIGVPDNMRGEAVKAFVVLKENVNINPLDIKYFAREHLANFKVPQTVEIRESLPKNRTGKIDKEALKLEVMA